MTKLATSCPVGCGRDVDDGKLMCRPCWSQVPLELQRAVYRTWGRYRSMIGSARRTGKTAALEDYRAARDAAIASVT